MIGERRTGPVFGVLFAGVSLLTLRLGCIQVFEHEVWADDAARLLHSGTVLPYRRGPIVDDLGRPLVVDGEAYHLVVSYRELRRENPLGQVAHALAAALGRPVALPVVAPELEVWVAALARLSPTQLREFEEGGPLRIGATDIPPSREPGPERRATRASDLHFYVARLVDPDREHRRVLDRARRSDHPQPSYAALVAGDQAETAEDDVVAAARARARAAGQALALLARELAWSGGDTAVRLDSGSSDLDLLLEALDERRRAVEDRAAARLATEVLGFPPGRLEPALLLGEIDLSWLQRLLAWDDARLAGWARGRRSGWLAWREDFAVPYLLGDMTTRSREDWRPDQVLSRVAALFGTEEAWSAALDGRPVDWRGVQELAVLARLPALFAAGSPRGSDPAALRPLPIQDEDLRASNLEGDARWLLLARAATLPPGSASPGDRRWSGLSRLDGLPTSSGVREAALGLAKGWEALLQEAAAGALGELRAAAEADALSPQGRLLIEPEWLDQADARMRFLLIDHGSRPHVLEREPSFDAVHLLTRMASHFGGLRAADVRERVPVVLDGEPGLPGTQLIGEVLGADPEDLRGQRADLVRLADLRRDPDRTPAEDAELARLLGAVRLTDEARGVSGIESHWDAELRGVNGFREAQGLEDLYGHGRWVSVREPLDGAAVTLTLRADVQLACERALWMARPPLEDEQRDDAWYRYPVGAVVLATVEGDVVAAASSPPPWADVPAATPGPLQPLERTLRQPDFQPPGSVFKPFVAAWALSHLAGFDPLAEEASEELEPGHWGYGGVRCWSRVCHPPQDLHGALVHSCNSYFARLGESLSTEDFAALADAFGFGEPTGVLQHADRGGLMENTIDYVFKRPMGEPSRRRAGNGLSVVEATPAQVARGMIGLATGRLPSLRLVRAVGEEPLPRRPAEALGIPAADLDRVRAAMIDVANHAEGTAYAVLNEGDLGFRAAVKTGSADLVGRGPDGVRGRKHTWVAGWAPADDPAVVFVLFVHDTTATSSHGAVWLARDVLTEPTVRAWLAEQGVGR